MKQILRYGVVPVVAFGLAAWGTPPACAGDRLTLAPAQVVDVTGESVARFLVDEQSEAGDPRRGTGGKPATEWTLGWTNWETIHPLEAVVDLGSVHDLDGVGWFDGAGQQELVVSVWQAEDWKEIARDPLTQFGQWTVRNVAARSRYVRFLQAKPGGTVHEIVLYGTPLSPAAAPPAVNPPIATLPSSNQVPMELFIGTNGFITSPVERVAKVAGVMREYHQWQWDEGNQDPAYRGGRAAWNPSWVSGPGWGWNFDDFYTRLRDAGIEVQPVTQGTLPYLIDGQEAGVESRPALRDRPTERPASYREHSEYHYQFAARYGRQRVDEKSLRLKDDQQPRTGLDLVRWIENWNEPDKTWKGRSGRFRPWELAALCSADYDGHRGTMGPGCGLKTADPEMRMLSGGLFKLNVDYLRAMKLWSDLHRAGTFPADAIAVHGYSRTAENFDAGQAESPETHGLVRKLRDILDWRDRECPNLEVWFGEFGYDTHPASPQVAQAFPGQSIEQTQGLWLVRTFLLSALAGVDRAQMYMLADVDADSRTQFDTSGLLRSEKQGYVPKPSYHHVATLRHVLTGTRFADRLEPDRTDLFALRFTDDSRPGRAVVAVWADESHAEKRPTLSLPAADVSVQLIRLADDREQGIASEAKVVAGRIRIEATPSPVFVILDTAVPRE